MKKESSGAFPYKGLKFEKLKEANQYVEFVMGTEYDKLGLEHYLPEIEEISQLKEAIESSLDRIEDNDKYLIEYYPNGYLKSDEWKKRKQINFLYQFYQDYWNILLIGAREKVQKIVHLSKYDLKGTSNSELNNCLLRDTFRRNYDTPEIREISRQLKEQIRPIDIEIMKYKDQYRELHLSTKLPKGINIVKEDTLKRIDEVQKYKKWLKLKETRVNLDCKSLLDNYEYITVPELSKEQILQSETEYNIFILHKDKLYSTRFIHEVNGRLVIVKNNNQIAVNEDIVIIDKMFSGSLLSNLKDLSFYNENEVDFYRKQNMKGYKARELEKFYGVYI